MPSRRDACCTLTRPNPWSQSADTPEWDNRQVRYRREVYVDPLDPNDQQAVIATDTSSVILRYVTRVSEGLWPSWFVKLVTLDLAVQLSQTITGKASLYKVLADERERQLVFAKNEAGHEDDQWPIPMPTADIDVRGSVSSSAPDRIW